MLTRDLMKEIHDATLRGCPCQKRPHNWLYHAPDCRVKLLLGEAEERLKACDELADLVAKAVEEPAVAAEDAFRTRAATALGRNAAMIGFRAWGRRHSDPEKRDDPF
jgi:hypothetical protein